MDKRLITVVTFLIASVWVTSSIVAMVDHKYAMPLGIQAAMGAVVGYLFTSKAKNGHDKK